MDPLPDEAFTCLMHVARPVELVEAAPHVQVCPTPVVSRRRASLRIRLSQAAALSVRVYSNSYTLRGAKTLVHTTSCHSPLASCRIRCVGCARTCTFEYISPSSFSPVSYACKKTPPTSHMSRWRISCCGDHSNPPGWSTVPPSQAHSSPLSPLRSGVCAGGSSVLHESSVARVQRTPSCSRKKRNQLPARARAAGDCPPCCGPQFADTLLLKASGLSATRRGRDP